MAKKGQNSKYKKEFDEQAFKLALLGLTDKKIAEFFCVVESTLNLWKKEHKSFSESLTRGKLIADGEAAYGLHRRVTGYDTTISKPVVVSDGAGAGSHVEQHPLGVHIPPDPSAIKHWLSVRQANLWREKKDEADTDKLDQLIESIDRSMKS